MSTKVDVLGLNFEKKCEFGQLTLDGKKIAEIIFRHNSVNGVFVANHYRISFKEKYNYLSNFIDSLSSDSEHMILPSISFKTKEDIINHWENKVNLQKIA